MSRLIHVVLELLFLIIVFVSVHVIVLLVTHILIVLKLLIHLLLHELLLQVIHFSFIFDLLLLLFISVLRRLWRRLQQITAREFTHLIFNCSDHLIFHVLHLAFPVRRLIKIINVGVRAGFVTYLVFYFTTPVCHLFELAYTLIALVHLHHIFQKF